MANKQISYNNPFTPNTRSHMLFEHYAKHPSFAEGFIRRMETSRTRPTPRQEMELAVAQCVWDQAKGHIQEFQL